MTPDAIRAAILASPDLLALLPDSQALATALSQGRTRLVERMISERRIVALLGIERGEAFLAGLEAFAAASLPADHPMAGVQAGIRRMAGWLKEPEGVDVGNPLAQQALAGLAAAGVLNAADAEIVAAFAREPDPVSEFDVRRAIFRDDGTLFNEV